MSRWVESRVFGALERKNVDVVVFGKGGSTNVIYLMTKHDLRESLD